MVRIASFLWRKLKDKERDKMRVMLALIASIFLFLSPESLDEEEVSLIVEVEADPHEIAEEIELHYPNLEVVEIYDILLQGIAIKGDAKAIKKVTQHDDVITSYPVQTYTNQMGMDTSIHKIEDRFANPNDINDTEFTGKNVKVGVIDTGIDYTHPDLSDNYKGGYDLVDLDDDPMETTETLPTIHGTHVAGIIAADGGMQGVAPDADIYAYRALGPGGMGTSIQIIAALERAIQDDMEVLNLSLGNTVNGPDYPTSKAVSKASDKGVAIVVANGNAGPDRWSVGAPATSPKAFSVGAYEKEIEKASLYINKTDKQIPLKTFPFAPDWDFERDYELTFSAEKVRGKIGITEINPEKVMDDIRMMNEKGAEAVVLYEDKKVDPEWIEQLQEMDVDIPIATMSTKNGRELKKQLEEGVVYVETTYETLEETIASFSSRGPVTVDWQMKPDIIAPGVNIFSTVPGGYDVLNGTSMAAPHIAGAIAVMKEARPNWSNEQIFNALKTTAKQIRTSDNKFVTPVAQGMGLVQLSNAIHTEFIIHDAALSFGKVNRYLKNPKREMTIENMSDEEKQFRFSIPHNDKGLTWNLPQTITVPPNEKQQIPIELQTNSLLLDEGIFQGWLEMEQNQQKLQLPYVLMNETSNYKKVMGFTFEMNPLDEEKYDYQLYAPEKVESIQVKLFHPESLLYKGKLMELNDVEIGMNEGEMKVGDIDFEGEYYALIVVELKNGDIAHYDTMLLI